MRINNILAILISVVGFSFDPGSCVGELNVLTTTATAEFEKDKVYCSGFSGKAKTRCNDEATKSYNANIDAAVVVFITCDPAWQ